MDDTVTQLAEVRESGNSHVYVHVDTRAIAFAMLACLHATGRFSDDEMNTMTHMLNQNNLSALNSQRYFTSPNRLENVRMFANN